MSEQEEMASRPPHLDADEECERCHATPVAADTETACRVLVQNLPEAVFTLDAEGRIIQANRTAELEFGFDSPCLHGASFGTLVFEFADFSSRAPVPLTSEWLEKCAATTQSLDVLGASSDGAGTPFAARCVRLMLHGETAYLLTLRNIAARKESEAQLYTSETFLRRIVQTAGNAIIAVDSELAIALFNPSAEEIFGYAAHEVIGKPLSTLIPEEYHDRHDDNMRRFAELDSCPTRMMGERGSISGLRKDGTVFPAEASISHFRIEGRPVYTVVLRDVTELRRAEEALRLSEARLADAQRIGRLGNWHWDIGTGELYWSDEVYRIFGLDLSSSDVTYEMFLRCVHPEDRQRVAAAVDHAVNGETGYRIDHRIVLPDGRIRTVHEQGEVVRNADGTATAMTGIVQDITEQNERERQLRKAKHMAEVANKAKTEFLANMSHELRTPLNAVIGFSEIIAQELFGPIEPAKYQTYAEQIMESGEHLLALINNILDMSKIEAGRMTLSESELDIAEILLSGERILSERALGSDLTLSCTWEASLPLLIADELLVRQILLNLLSNAIKFTGQGGKVLFRAHTARDGGLVISVADTGIGMTEGEIAKALEVFGQADNSLSRRFGGAGLGLPLTASLVKLHQGTLTIESKPGRGTTVRVWFPPARVVARSLLRARG